MWSTKTTCRTVGKSCWGRIWKLRQNTILKRYIFAISASRRPDTKYGANRNTPTKKWQNSRDREWMRQNTTILTHIFVTSASGRCRVRSLAQIWTTRLSVWPAGYSDRKRPAYLAKPHPLLKDSLVFYDERQFCRHPMCLRKPYLELQTRSVLKYMSDRPICPKKPCLEWQPRSVDKIHVCNYWPSQKKKTTTPMISLVGPTKIVLNINEGARGQLAHERQVSNTRLVGYRWEGTLHKCPREVLIGQSPNWFTTHE